MSIIRATCKSCGDVELKSYQLWINRIITPVDPVNFYGDEYYEYGFRCPSCQLVTLRPADDPIVDVLLAAGVKERDISLRRAQPSGYDRAAARFDSCDEIDFYNFIQDDKAFLEQMRAALRPPKPIT